MNLRTRRAIDLVQNRDVPAAQTEIAGYLGKTLTLTIDWDTFEDVSEDTVFSVNGLGLKKVAGAMLMATNEEFVKNAFVDALAAAHFEHVGMSTDKALSLEEATLRLAINFADLYEGGFTEQEIFDFLMDIL